MALSQTQTSIKKLFSLNIYSLSSIYFIIKMNSQDPVARGWVGVGEIGRIRMGRGRMGMGLGNKTGWGV